MQNSIPKIIHYCWFGGNEKPELVKKCIESWKKVLPDYTIREWNDEDLKTCSVQYVLDAVKEKKWAFVSDYYRLYALYTKGGIYFDSDNEVFKSFDEFLNLDFFTGYEKYKKEIHSFTAVVGAKKGNHIIKNLLDEYNTAKFYDEFGRLNLMTNTQRVEHYFQEHYNINPPFDAYQKVELEQNCVLFPANYFCEYEPDISYAVHHFNGSWIPPLRGKKRYYVTKHIYVKPYAISKGHFKEEIRNIKEQIIFWYPRYKKSTVAITLGKDDE